MYYTIKRIYLEGRINDAGLDKAVAKGWITEAQEEEIKQAKANGEKPESVNVSQ